MRVVYKIHQIKELLKLGYKVTHVSFSASEFVFKKGTMILTEEDYRIPEDIFWKDRSSNGFDDNWFLYDDTDSIKKSDFSDSEISVLMYTCKNICNDQYDLSISYQSEIEKTFSVMDNIVAVLSPKESSSVSAVRIDVNKIMNCYEINDIISLNKYGTKESIILTNTIFYLACQFSDQIRYNKAVLNDVLNYNWSNESQVALFDFAFKGSIKAKTAKIVNRAIIAKDKLSYESSTYLSIITDIATIIINLNISDSASMLRIKYFKISDEKYKDYPKLRSLLYKLLDFKREPFIL